MGFSRFMTGDRRERLVRRMIGAVSELIDVGGGTIVALWRLEIL